MFVNWKTHRFVFYLSYQTITTISEVILFLWNSQGEYAINSLYLLMKITKFYLEKNFYKKCFNKSQPFYFQIFLPWKIFNPFVPNSPFLYPLKTSENLTVFWCFQGVEKECIGNKWVKDALKIQTPSKCLIKVDNSSHFWDFFQDYPTNILIIYPVLLFRFWEDISKVAVRRHSTK